MGHTYLIEIDGNYNNPLANPYTANTGADAEPIHWGDRLVAGY